MKHIAGALLVGMGLVGLYFSVGYSGWVVFVGLLVVVS